MGTGCTKEPRVNETNKRNNKLLMNKSEIKNIPSRDSNKRKKSRNRKI